MAHAIKDYLVAPMEFLKVDLMLTDQKVIFLIQQDVRIFNLSLIKDLVQKVLQIILCLILQANILKVVTMLVFCRKNALISLLEELKV